MNRPDPSGSGKRVMTKIAKASRTYQDSLDNDVEILVLNQGSGVPGISQSTTSSRPANISATESYAIRHRYNYREDINSEGGE